MLTRVPLTHKRSFIRGQGPLLPFMMDWSWSGDELGSGEGKPPHPSISDDKESNIKAKPDRIANMAGSSSVSVSLQPLHLQSAYVRRDVAIRTHETQRLPVTQRADSHLRLSIRPRF